MTDLNIVQLIETNPITRLSNTYQGKLLNKIKDTFTDNEQHMFVASFYCYLNCNQKTDFIIDLDKVWEWMGFSHKDKAKRLLEKSFSLGNDYKSLLTPKGEQKGTGRGGHNKEIIMMTVKTFKSLCLKADTKKADEIHKYYLKLEEILQDLIEEEGNELRLQLEKKDKLLENSINAAEKEKELLREKTILEQFPNNVQCVYYGIIDNLSSENEPLIKFGNSNNLRERIDSHKRTFSNFRLVNAFKVDNKIQLENAIKKHDVIIEKRRHITIKDVKHTELLTRHGLSFNELDKIIKDVIESMEYNAENYKKLVKDNINLNSRIKLLIVQVENLKSQKNTTYNSNVNEDIKELTNKVLLLEEENIKLKGENMKLIKKYKLDKTLDAVSSSHETTTINSPPVTDEQYNTITKSMKRIAKSPDGCYYIDGAKYEKLFGSRDEVWNGGAYKTAGELTKSAFIINKNGKIVSKKKFIQEKAFNRLEAVNNNKKGGTPDSFGTPKSHDCEAPWLPG